MGKNHLTLYIDTEIIELAKASNMNISKEFNEWLRIRLNKPEETQNKTEDPDLIIAQCRAEILKMETRKELMADKEKMDKELNMIVEHMVDNIIEFRDEGDEKDMTYEQIIEKRAFGLQFIIKKRLNRQITTNEAKELLLNIFKQRNISVQ